MAKYNLRGVFLLYRTECIQHNRSRETKSRSDSEMLLGNPEFHYRERKTLTLIPTRGQKNPVRTSSPLTLKCLSHLRSGLTRDFFPYDFKTMIVYEFLLLRYLSLLTCSVGSSVH